MIVQNWIDAHGHFYPPETPARRSERLVEMQAADWQVTVPPGWSEEATLAYMDETGIAMQMLSNIPKTLDELRYSNDFGSSLARKYPSRFGFLMGLPTDNPDEALKEIDRGINELGADGFAVTCHYNEVYLSDPSLDPVWQELDNRNATVFAHPDVYVAGTMGRPAAFMEVASETARTVVDMIYAGTFRKFPNMNLLLAHCGGTLPALAGRLQQLGFETWLANPNEITREEMQTVFRKLFLDTAAVCPHALAPALEMSTYHQIVYGSDCGVACTTTKTMNANIEALLSYDGLSADQIEYIGRNALKLFPQAAARL